MAIISGVGTTWNLPNFAGELFTADTAQTPLLSMIGGMTGGMMTTQREFPTAQLFEYPAPEQPKISEMTSIKAPDPRVSPRNQETNVVQRHHLSTALTYERLASQGRMSGLNTAGQTPSPTDELAWQITHSMLIPTARDIEKSFIEGQYHLAANVNDVNTTRGMLELCADGTTIDAAGAPLGKDILQALYREMANAGAYFDNMVMFVDAALKQQISEIYTNQMGFVLPATRNVGGVDIQEVMTDFFTMGVVWSRFMPAGKILICDVNHMAPVFMEVPGKGVLFVEELAREGAAERRQMYGHIGLAHGPAFLHGSITGLAV